uniref:S haplotype-specific F-box protein, putative n=1 Tax=Solanum demissum TaxID=50514 RepID=Q0KIR4_SOLDE|nr:S haplotype-specific F-box protein, putative [Solanum demissum]
MGIFFNTKYGFGYDDSSDDYKALFIDHCCDSYNDEMSNMRIVVNIYSLRTDSWTTLHDQLHGIFIINHSADETWGCLELFVCGEDNSNIKLGVVGSAFCALFLPSRYYYF